MSPALEKQWIARVIVDGDPDAFKALVRLHQSQVRQFLRRLTHQDAALADDLAQETFLQVFRHIAGYRGDAKFSTWVLRIAYHQFLQHHRRRQGKEELRESWEDQTETASPEVAAGTSANLQLDVERALAGLSEAERAAITLCYHQDATHEDAARILDMPLGTLKSHVYRAKEKLKKQLDAWRTDHDR